MRLDVGILVAAAVALTLAVGGCGSSETEAQDRSAAGALAYAADGLMPRGGSGARVAPVYRAASELLGNVRYVRGRRRAEPLTDAVVVGTVSGVVSGAGFAAASDAGDARRGDGARAPFDSPDALWRTLHVTVDVEEVLTGDVLGDATQVTVGLAIGGAEVDWRRVAEGVRALGRSVWFLDAGSPVFAYDRSLYAGVEDGRLIGDVEPDGGVAFPLVGPLGEPASLLGRPALAQLRAAAQAPPREIRLHRDGAAWVR